MQRNIIETVIGALVLAVAGLFLMFAYQTADLGGVRGGYQVTAQFDRVTGLRVGNDVLISGVKVGTVSAQRLDPVTFLAEITLTLDPAIRLPTDTVAVIASDGLLGGKYLSLDPGADDETIADGGRIHYTQSTPGLEQLLGQVIYSLQGLGDD